MSAATRHRLILELAAPDLNSGWLQKVKSQTMVARVPGIVAGRIISTIKSASGQR